MAIFDITHLHALTQMKELFPELTEKQFRLALYWAWGVSMHDIAGMNDSSAEAVKKLLHRCKDRIGVESLETMRSAILLRLFASLWSRGSRA